MIYAFIKEHQELFRVVKMCKVLAVSKSGYYAWLKRETSIQALRRKELTKEVKRIHEESENRYGSTKIHRKLSTDGVLVSERTVQRIMKTENIHSCIVKKFKVTTDSNHQNPIYPNLLRQDFSTQHPGEVWVADITYIWTRQGWLYLASVMDLYSRKIIGFNMGDRLKKELVITALKRAMAHQAPKKGLIHHSDRGSQYASPDYTDLLKTAKIEISMSGKGNCYDNACIEAFHSILKRELIYQEDYQTREEARHSITKYILTFYNSKRIHSSLDYMTPNMFEKRYYSRSQVI